MNLVEIEAVLNDWLSSWNVGPGVALLAGLLVGFALAAIPWLRSRRLVRRLRATSFSKDQKLGLLAERFRLLQVRLERAQATSANLENAVQELQQQVDVLRMERDTLKEEYASLKQESEAQKQRAETSENQHDELRQQHNELAQQHNSLAQNYTALNQRFNEQVGRHNALVTLYNELRQRHNGLVQQYNDVVCRYRALGQQRSSLVQQYNARVQQFNALRQRLLERTQDNSTLTTRNGVLENSAGELTNKIHELEQENCELKQIQDELEAETRKLQHEAAAKQQPIPEQPYKTALLKTAASCDPPDTAEPALTTSRWAGAHAILGLDFGTHSTKLVLRVHGDSETSALVLDEPAPNYPWFAIPSLVHLLDDGRLFFGRQALQQTGGKLFRSLKVELLPPTDTNGWHQDEYSPKTTPDLLVALYLAWVLGRFKAALGTSLPRQFALNMAAPMNHVEDEKLKERYLHVVQAAWEVTFGNHVCAIQQGARLSQLRPLFELLLAQPVPARTIRRFEVLPETLAPLVSLTLDPQVRPGRYMMIDMGAGTTEFSINKLEQLDARRSIRCYEDASLLLGGDQFQAIKQMHQGNGVAGDQAPEMLQSELVSKFRKVWYAGYTKEKNGGQTLVMQWMQLTVLLSGGGLRNVGLHAAIQNNSPVSWAFPPNPVIDYKVDWHCPANLHFFSVRQAWQGDNSQDVLPFLAVAHGLSLHRMRWPRFDPPREVATIAPPGQEKALVH